MALDAGVTAGSHGGDVVKGIMGFFTACIIAGFVLAAVEDRWIRGECYEDGSCQVLVGTRLGILWDGDNR